MAYGHLRLKPVEFWELTPREFALMYKGWQEREERMGRYVQWLIAPHMGSKTPKLHEITGFEPEELTGGTPKYVPREEQDRVLTELREQLLR